MSKFLVRLQSFIELQPRLGQSTYVSTNDDSIRLYLRNINTAVDNQLVTALVIANIVISEDIRRQAIGSTLIQVIHSFNKNQVTLVECVFSEILLEHLLKQGWLIAENTVCLPSAYIGCSLYKNTSHRVE